MRRYFACVTYFQTDSYGCYSRAYGHKIGVLEHLERVGSAKETKKKENLTRERGIMAATLPPLFSALLRFLVFFVAKNEAAQYCARWTRNEANSTGFFAMTIPHPGKAIYQYNLDLQQLRTTCDLSKGLGLRLSSNWRSNQPSGQGIFKCNSTAVGDRYDPNFACSIGSSSKTCISLKRTAPDLFTYQCKYQSGFYGSCEVGDISGKFGPAMQSIVQTTTGAAKRINTFISNSVLTDYQPPYESQYMKTSLYSNMWASIVVTCNADSSTLLCAKLQYVAPNEASACGFPPTVVQLHGTTEGNIIQLNGEEIAVTIISALFFLYVIFTAYVLISRRGFAAPVSMNDEDVAMVDMATKAARREEMAVSDRLTQNRSIV